MKQIRSYMGIAALALVFVLALAACETPTNSGDEGSDGPEDGIPWVFENQSSYDIRISPDNSPEGVDLDPVQGWDTFLLRMEGGIKTVRVNKIYDKINFAYTRSNSVEPKRVDGEDKIIFTNLE
jgi:hypothetical protein